MSKKVDEHLKEAIDNIREDRKITRELLDDAIKFVAKDEARHQQIGITLAKYVETLQRSNEQIVKIAALMSKNEKSEGLTDDDMDNIYSMIKKEEDPFTANSEEAKRMLVSLHDDAFLEASGMPVIPKFGDKVVCTKLDGRVFVIDKVLTNESIFMAILGGVGGDLASLFAGGLAGLLGDGGLAQYIGLSGNNRYSAGGKSVFMEGKVYRPRVRTYIGPRPEWNGKEIENGVFMEGFHEKIEGYTLGVQPTFIKDAVPGFKSMATAFEQNFGEKIKINDSFRSWAGQVAVRKSKPTLAARPGTSNHGWGLAFDYSTKWKGKSSFSSETYQWLYQNAPTYGFFSPKWARPTGSKPEAWHFEWSQPGKLYKK
jgi:hypothetical protein